MEEILKYFPSLSDTQKQQFALMGDLYREWNAKINVVSRKDIDNIYEHHILHSLAIAGVMRFRPGTQVMDVGTGGGFPGIPLAVMFPEAQFHLVDSIGKKIKVCNEVIAALQLTNVTTAQCRVEEEKRKFDFVVSRAVMPLPDLVRLVQKNIDHKQQKNSLPNGLICLKGGNLDAELHNFRNRCDVTPIPTIFPQHEYFDTKQVIYLPL